ncbi:MAG: Transpeptidase protein [Chloroflexi bacterium]|nr:Transpeptidase protein [Chloroflexota bacterium]
MLVTVALALGYWQVIRADDLLGRPTNPRIIEEERRHLRGRILDRHGEVLASSKKIGELAERTYAYAPLAHVTGYASTIHGKSGIEEAYDPFLRGDRGSGLLTRLQRRVLPADQVGTDIVLTIDLELQRVADGVLGNDRGAVIAINVATGEVLALASHPYFDPNTLDESWEQLATDSATPFVDRATQGQYVPGSVFKIVTASAAVDLRVADPNERHRHEGDLVVDGFRIRNTNHPQLTDLSWAEEFAWSCNPMFAYTGLSLGFPGAADFNVMSSPQPFTFPSVSVAASVDRFREYAQRFGIGQRVPFDLPTSAGRISSGPSMTAVELANTAFGQGDLQVSPLQMALAAATIANGGVMPAPYLASESRGPHGNTTLHRGGETLRRVVSPATAAAVNQMMVLSVDTAYAQPARIAGVRVAGKTGTAEVGAGSTPHAWFIGYAPADRPGVAVAVIMENRGSGTQFATPAAQKVLEAALRLGY